MPVRIPQHALNGSMLIQVDKVLQLHLACSQRIGVIIVGPPGSGKSTTWRLLQAALSSLGRPPFLHVVNPKAISRHHLLGQHCPLTVQLPLNKAGAVYRNLTCCEPPISSILIAFSLQ